MAEITFADFEKVHIEAGTILEAREFVGARKPAYQLLIDFGEKTGIKRSSAQITQLYSPESLVGRQVLAVTNFPPRQIANFFSEVLVLGLYNADGHVVLLQPERPVANGTKVC